MCAVQSDRLVSPDIYTLNPSLRTPQSLRGRLVGHETFLLRQQSFMAFFARSSIVATTSGFNDRHAIALILFCGRAVMEQRPDEAGNAVALMGTVTLC